MNKVITFFTGATALKLIGIAMLISGLTYFIEKPFPSIFLGLRLIAFLLFVYAVIRYFNRK